MNRIRELRRERKVTMAELSRKTQIAVPDISRLERGMLPMYPGWADRIAAALSVTKEELTREPRRHLKKPAQGSPGPR